MSHALQFPIIDGHNDTLQNVYLPDKAGSYSFFGHNETGHLDLIRAHKGGFGGGFFAMYVPPEPGTWGPMDREITPAPQGWSARYAPRLDQAYALRYTFGLTASLFRLESESDGQLKVVRTTDELETCLKTGVIAAILHIEGAEAIDAQLNALHVFYQAGLRSVGIVWSRPNDFGWGVPFGFPFSPDQGPGLTDAGKALVRTCNQLGILLDVSHLNEAGFWDVAGLSQQTFVASHSGAHALCPSARNLTDKQLAAIGECKGLVGVNFNVSDLRSDGQRNPDTPLTEIVRHAAYIAERIGIDCVALGSDFDGATMPNELKDAAGLPKLLAAFRKAGFDDAALRKITSENWLRVLKTVWH